MVILKSNIESFLRHIAHEHGFGLDIGIGIGIMMCVLMHGTTQMFYLMETEGH